MPRALEAVVRPHSLREEMVVEAALTGNRELALAALSSDPLLGSPEAARAVLAELLAGTREWLGEPLGTIG